MKITTKTLKELFLDELADIYNAEHQLMKGLPKLAKIATCTLLQQALLSHLKETEGHVTKLEAVFESIGEDAKGKICEATKGLLEEADEIAANFEGSPAINAAIISAAQKVEHYEIASYGCLHEWAGLLENDKAAALLEEILNEEKAANHALTGLARTHGNLQAMGNSDDDTFSEDEKYLASSGQAA